METPKAVVQVGKVMEVTGDEMRTLEECAQHMHTASRTRLTGWLMEYMRAHRAAHRIFQTILTRSHAN